jgi:hypothetical protein
MHNTVGGRHMHLQHPFCIPMHTTICMPHMHVPGWGQPYDTQFIFGSLMFVAGEDGNLELLTRSLASKHHTPVYGQAPYLPASSSTSDEAYSSLNPYAGSYHRAAKTT